MSTELKKRQRKTFAEGAEICRAPWEVDEHEYKWMDRRERGNKSTSFNALFSRVKADNAHAKRKKLKRMKSLLAPQLNVVVHHWRKTRQEAYLIWDLCKKNDGCRVRYSRCSFKVDSNHSMATASHMMKNNSQFQNEKKFCWKLLKLLSLRNGENSLLQTHARQTAPKPPRDIQNICLFWFSLPWIIILIMSELCGSLTLVGFFLRAARR